MPVTRPIRCFRPVLAFRLSAAAAILLANCQPNTEATEPGADRPIGPMYSCIGEPAYSRGWDEILAEIQADLDSNPPDCESSGPRSYPGISSMVVRDPDSAPASARIHTYVMDSQCHFLWEFRDTVTLSPGAFTPISIAPTYDPAGNPLPTGEYFMNTELQYSDGSKDTSYQKIGFIRDPCLF